MQRKSFSLSSTGSGSKLRMQRCNTVQYGATATAAARLCIFPAVDRAGEHIAIEGPGAWRRDFNCSH